MTALDLMPHLTLYRYWTENLEMCSCWNLWQIYQEPCSIFLLFFPVSYHPHHHQQLPWCERMGTSTVILEDPFQTLHLSHPGDPLIRVWTGVCEKNTKSTDFGVYSHVSFKGNIIVMTLATCGYVSSKFLNHLNAELKPTCHLLALLEAHQILHLSRIRVNEKIYYN